MGRVRSCGLEFNGINICRKQQNMIMGVLQFSLRLARLCVDIRCGVHHLNFVYLADQDEEQANGNDVAEQEAPD